MNAMLQTSASTRRLVGSGLASAVVLTLFPALAHAHAGIGPSSGAWSGVAHPLGGLDHFAAMVAVGLWAAQSGGAAVWCLPLVFVTVVALGGALGMVAITVPAVEPGIVASVLVLGLLVFAAMRLPIMASSLLVGVFALVHGHAHGTELPATVGGLTYAGGFMLATAALVLFGLGVGRSMERMKSAWLLRFAGGAIAACGLYLCFV